MARGGLAVDEPGTCNGNSRAVNVGQCEVLLFLDAQLLSDQVDQIGRRVLRLEKVPL